MINLTITGNLGADAKLVQTEKSAFISFSVAELGSDNPQWIECTKNVTLKEGQEPKLLELLKKGTTVYLSGRPHAKAYKEKGILGLYVDVLELV